jgi:hypothetical protein
MIFNRFGVPQHKGASMPMAAVPARDRDRVEVRVLTLVLSTRFLYDLLEPVLFAVTAADGSPFHRMLAQSHVQLVLSVVFFSALLLALPMWLSLLFAPVTRLAHRLPRRLACYAATIATVTWFYLSALSVSLDYTVLPWVYVRNGCWSLVMAGIYALSLNAQQVRALYSKARYEAQVYR